MKIKILVSGAVLILITSAAIIDYVGRTLVIDLRTTRQTSSHSATMSLVDGTNELRHVRSIDLSLPDGTKLSTEVIDLLIDVQDGKVHWLRWQYDECERDAAAADLLKVASAINAKTDGLSDWVDHRMLGNYSFITRRSGVEFELQVRPTFNVNPNKKWAAVLQIYLSE